MALSALIKERIITMIELSEAIPFADKANTVLKNHYVKTVEVLNAPHKFAWLNHHPDEYHKRLTNRQIKEVKASSHYIRFIFDDSNEIAIGEDVVMKYGITNSIDPKSQLLLHFSNGYSLSFKIKLYGFIFLGTEEELIKSEPYYAKAVNAVSPLSDEFTYDYFKERTNISSDKGSLKQALATEQHIPGLGNGLLQDVLFDSGYSPKRKLSTLNEADRLKIYQSVKTKIKEIVLLGGRDLQSDMLDTPGGYETLMTTSRQTCPKCHGNLIKEAYLGGKVIYCPSCQK